MPGYTDVTEATQLAMLMIWCPVHRTFLCRRHWSNDSPASEHYQAPGHLVMQCSVLQEIRPYGRPLGTPEPANHGVQDETKEKPILLDDLEQDEPVEVRCEECRESTTKRKMSSSESHSTQLGGRWLCPRHYHAACKKGGGAGQNYGRDVQVCTYPVLTNSATIIQSAVFQPVGH